MERRRRAATLSTSSVRWLAAIVAGGLGCSATPLAPAPEVPTISRGGSRLRAVVFEADGGAKIVAPYFYDTLLETPCRVTLIGGGTFCDPEGIEIPGCDYPVAKDASQLVSFSRARLELGALTLDVATGQDGSSTIFRFEDTREHMRCALQSMAPRKPSDDVGLLAPMRCAPVRAAVDATFSDAGCGVPAGRWPTYCGGTPDVIAAKESTATCGQVTHYWTVERTTAAYVPTAPDCVRDADAIAAVRGAEIDPSEFPEVETVLTGSGRLKAGTSSRTRSTAPATGTRRTRPRRRRRDRDCVRIVLRRCGATLHPFDPTCPNASEPHVSCTVTSS